MEKLIELLNEYNRNVLKWSDKWELKNSIDNPWTKYISLSSVWAWKIYLWIISREYWFVKRLVEQDKIELEAWPLYWCQLIMHNRQPYTLYETLLMLLAISDTPIEDLISYLK
jgi:hypothetical protein